VSVTAVHRVIVTGPDDDLLFRLLVVVAEWPDTDIDGRGHPISQVVVAQRIGRSLWYTRTLMADCVATGWLVCHRRNQGRMSLWKLGPNFAQLRVVTAKGSRERRSDSRTTSRGLSTISHADVDVSRRKRAHPPAEGGGGAAHETRDVPPGRPKPVENSVYAHYPNWTAERHTREKDQNDG